MSVNVPERPSDAELSRRRDAALKLSREGHPQTSIAKKLRVSQPTICRWLQRTQRPGATKAPAADLSSRRLKAQNGRAPKVTDTQLKRLFTRRRESLWTGSQFRDAIRKKFGVEYSLQHCCALLTYLRTGQGTRFDAQHRARGAAA